MKTKLIVANWKMNMTKKDADAFFKKSNFLKEEKESVIIAVPSILLPDYDKSKNFLLAAQDVSAYEKGAYTGEVSASMLQERSVRYCVVGHSERRVYHHESSQMIAQKAQQLQKKGIIPIVCIGENQQEKKVGLTKKVLSTQLRQSLKGVDLASCVIAYEPVWAISTFQKSTKKVTPSLDEIYEAHEYIRSSVERLDAKMGKQVRILYGGSVDAANSSEIGALSCVDGVLVGGASLVVSSFTEIINNMRNV